MSGVKEKISSAQTAIAGGAAGALTRAVAQPLDVLKIRFQLQLEPIKHSNNSKYASILQAGSKIIKEEGLAALWSGHVPAQLLSITYGTLQFSTFEKLIQLSQQSSPFFFNSHRHAINFTSGAVAASVATIASFPFDTVRTRLIAEQKNNKVYHGLSDAFSKMWIQEGPRCFFKGLLPTLAQIAPHAGVQFTIYKLFTDNILNKITFFQRQISVASTVETSLIANVIAGSVAGFVSKTVIYPFDLMKKRLQIQGFQQHRQSFGRQMYCQGLLHCIKLTITEEGFLALYKGYGPSMLKAALVSAMHFTVYDEIKHFFMRVNS